MRQDDERRALLEMLFNDFIKTQQVSGIMKHFAEVDFYLRMAEFTVEDLKLLASQIKGD